VKSRFSRREKMIIRLTIIVVVLAVFSQFFKVYRQARTDLEAEIESLQTQITDMDKLLRGQSPQQYLDEADEIAEDLGDMRESVLVLPNETNASLLVRQTIAERAETAGIKINSISSRRSKDIEGTDNLMELRVYFGWDADLESLVQFFDMLENEEYYMVIETLNVSARRKLRNIRNRRRRANSRLKEREPLNGNAVIAVLFRADPDAPLDRYSRPDTIGTDERPETPAETDGSVGMGAGEGEPEALDTEPEPLGLAELLDTNDPRENGEAEDEDDFRPDENGELPRPLPVLQPKPAPLTTTARPSKKPERKPIKDRF